jgi:hypothetical protein
LTLNQTIPDVETAAGTFSIDSALLTPNTQINFQDFLSFDISVQIEGVGFQFTLSDAADPANTGVITDASGTVVAFNNPSPSILNVFCFPIACPSTDGVYGARLDFLDGPPFDYGITTTIPGPFSTAMFTAGTYSIAVIPGTSEVPLPATLPLFATGLAALGFIGWRRRPTARRAD